MEKTVKGDIVRWKTVNGFSEGVVVDDTNRNGYLRVKLRGGRMVIVHRDNVIRT